MKNAPVLHSMAQAAKFLIVTIMVIRLSGNYYDMDNRSDQVFLNAS